MKHLTLLGLLFALSLSPLAFAQDEVQKPEPPPWTWDDIDD